MTRENDRRRKRSPARTEEGRENQMVSLATNLAEKQLREGTASSQIITHYLKLGTTREKLEQEKIARENLLLEAKVDQLAAAEDLKNLFTNAMDAFRGYAGIPQDDGPE